IRVGTGLLAYGDSRLAAFPARKARVFRSVRWRFERASLTVAGMAETAAIVHSTPKPNNKKMTEKRKFMSQKRTNQRWLNVSYPGESQARRGLQRREMIRKAKFHVAKATGRQGMRGLHGCGWRGRCGPRPAGASPVPW